MHFLQEDPKQAMSKTIARSLVFCIGEFLVKIIYTEILSDLYRKMKNK